MGVSNLTGEVDPLPPRAATDNKNKKNAKVRTRNDFDKTSSVIYYYL